MTATCPFLEFRTDNSGPGRDGYCTIKGEFLEDLEVPSGTCTNRGALTFEEDCPYYAAERGE